MKTNICLILTCLFLTSCYTKKRAIEKFCVQDSVKVSVLIHDTIIVDSSRVDTVFNSHIDTMVIENERVVVRYVRNNGKISLSGTAKADTIYRTIYRNIKVPTTCPKQLEWHEQLIRKWWFWVLVVLVILYQFRYSIMQRF